MSEPVRILFVVTALARFGGIEETIRILCAGLDRDRFRIGICVLQNPSPEAAAVFEELGVDLFPLRRGGYFFDPLTTFKVGRVIRRFGADIVHTHFNKGNLHGRLAAYCLRNVAIATTHHDLNDARFAKSGGVPVKQVTGGWAERILYPWLNVVLNRVNHKVIAVSDAVARVYARDGEGPRLKIVQAPFDETIFCGGAEPFGKTKQGGVVLGSTGRLEWEKGFHELLSAFEKIAVQFPDVRLDLVGDGSLRSQLESRVRASGLASRVRFTGPLPHNAEIYRSMDLYVQPSLFEGASITILEAMGVGLPVVATDSGGPAGLVRQGETGLLVPSGDANALSEAVVHLLKHPDEAIRMGEAGHRRAHDLFSSRVFIEEMTRIYLELADII